MSRREERAMAKAITDPDICNVLDQVSQDMRKLEAENKRLREALLMILEQCQKNGQEWDSKLRAARAFRAQIRAALEGGESEIERRERVLRQAAKKQWEEERKERARGDRP